ncbi:MAG: hypothetical protein JWN43_4010 [Gammaproteobacteria bacterium]|nr:hypothetical protein [Gammaproteobacteria bacterium]
MNTKRLFLGAAGLAVGLVAACHDDHHGAPAPPPSTSQSLDTAQVLALAQQTSETSSPIAVNGGALTLNDTSETSAPIAVNAM